MLSRFVFKPIRVGLSWRCLCRVVAFQRSPFASMPTKNHRLESPGDPRKKKRAQQKTGTKHLVGHMIHGDPCKHERLTRRTFRPAWRFMMGSYIVVPFGGYLLGSLIYIYIYRDG